MTEGIKYGFSTISPSSIKHKFMEMQQMTIPEIFIAFFKNIFNAFYYSGLGVSIVLRYVYIFLCKVYN